jgi:hypothetical protein
MTPLLLLLLAQDYVLLSDVAKEVSAQPEFVNKFVEGIRILGPDEVTRLRGYIKDQQWKALDSFPGITVKTLGRSVRMAGRVLPKPSGEPAPPSTPGPKPLGMGLMFGDEMLSLKDDSVSFAARLNEPNPEKLLRQLAADGHTIEVRDSRYFANFGDLKYKGKEVLTPFWLDTGIPIPGQNRNLLVPAPHSQHEIFITGPKVNASLCFFFGIDGKAVIRPIDTKDQAWVLGNTAHTYKGEQAIEAMRVIGEVMRVYTAIQKAHPELPFGGYYRMGVCNDPNAIIESKLNGKTTLYPLTHDKSLFTGYGEISDIVAKLPQDEESTSKDRVMGSLPVSSLEKLPMANLRSDILAASAVSTSGYSWLWLLLIPAAYFAWRSFSAASR